jgi:predicted RecB family nuclease
MRPARRREVVDRMRATWQVSIRRACSVLRAERSSYHYKAKRRLQAVLSKRIKMDRSKAYPNLHVYHYAPYQPVALKRLMGRYGTREDELDRLLRGKCFVDLSRWSSRNDFKFAITKSASNLSTAPRIAN